MSEYLSIFLEMHIEDAYRGEMICGLYFNILHTNIQKKISSKGRKVKLRILIIKADILSIVY